jgi:pimeloyl-ACP methyl ester carboxylesterase
MGTHSFPEHLPLGVNSVSQWSLRSRRELILFVHGFGGDAISTWNDMQLMLPLDARAADADLVYYGYESTRSRIVIHADRLREFIESIIARRGNYDRIVIAAHSLGAVIARRAIIVAHTSGAPWVKSVKAVLFGPAHRGASVQRLAVQGTGSSILGSVYAFMLFRMPVLQDLEPGCPFLEELRDEYLDHMSVPPNAPLLAKVIIGSKDNVVELLDFHPAERLQRSEGQTHTSVCKPRNSFLDPIEAVMEALK